MVARCALLTDETGEYAAEIVVSTKMITETICRHAAICLERANLLQNLVKYNQLKRHVSTSMLISHLNNANTNANTKLHILL